MTQIQSGYVNTGALSPTGDKKLPPVDSAYLEKDLFLQNPYASGLGLTNLSPEYTSGALDRLLLSASSQVNRMCRRFFDTQTVWETKTRFRAHPFNPQLTTVTLRNTPFQCINSIYIQVLQWFIQIVTSGSQSYLQTFPEWGYKIVPLLATSGTTGSPIPAAILDKVDLGIVWTNYTFGYGTPLTAQTLDLIPSSASPTQYTQYQAVIGNRLWAKNQTGNPLNIYIDGVLQTTGYSIDYQNAIVTFVTPLTISKVVTADFTTNESVPQDIKDATALLACYIYGQGKNNPLGASSYSMQTFSISVDGSRKNPLVEQAKEILAPYMSQQPTLI